MPPASPGLAATPQREVHGATVPNQDGAPRSPGGSVAAIAEVWTPRALSPRLSVPDEELRSQLHRNTVTMLLGERRKMAERIVASMKVHRHYRWSAAAFGAWEQEVVATRVRRRNLAAALRRQRRKQLSHVVRAWQLSAMRTRAELHRTVFERTEVQMRALIQSTLAEYDYVRHTIGLRSLTVPPDWHPSSRPPNVAALLTDTRAFTTLGPAGRGLSRAVLPRQGLWAGVRGRGRGDE